ncbi:hypothetical protein CRG98_000788 [Punica granatum]|uniref:Uncharacterized protein n=1 Tax=Punica granatum TaxID=22663 RepID=A0A2I0LDT6_PUNGR|nr:hypothetical protein CRG98_000788 [Punica granatum]
MRGKSDVEKSIQDVGVNNEVCNVEVEVKVVPDGSSRREKFSPEESRESIADNNEKFFCSQASDLGNQIARECLAGSSAGQSQQTNDAEVTERSTQLPCSDEVNASSNVTEEVSYQTVTSQALASATAKIKRQKGKNTQAMAPSPSPSTFNSADSSSEAVISSSLHSIEAAVPQIMHEKLNQKNRTSSYVCAYLLPAGMSHTSAPSTLKNRRPKVSHVRVVLEGLGEEILGN